MLSTIAYCIAKLNAWKLLSLLPVAHALRIITIPTNALEQALTQEGFLWGSSNQVQCTSAKAERVELFEHTNPRK